MTSFDRKPAPRPDELQQHVKGILGLGTLPGDGESRISKGPFYALFQGSAEVHDAMLSLCMRLEKELEARGLKLEELTQYDLIEVMEGLETNEEE